ncbi:MAG TPA: VWA domain-containing protein [Pyrinomonadaceae bacterium]|nr:VWA domain-containing protein [Pyrinomonadaceae bacterium]
MLPQARSAAVSCNQRERSTKFHEKTPKQFVLVRVISWIVASVKTLLKNKKLRTCITERTLSSAVLALLFINAHGQEQLQTQSKDEQSALVYGLVVDNSGSLRSQMAEVVEAAKLIVNSNQSGDEAFLVRFVDHDKIKTLQNFTSNKAALVTSLEGMYVEGGSSAIVDAVSFSIQHFSQDRRPNGSAVRRALIVLTDGDERSSFYKLEQLLKLVLEKNIKVYVIGFNQALKLQGLNTQKRATNLLNRIADGSGGRAFFPNSIVEVRNVANSILGEIRKPDIR